MLRTIRVYGRLAKFLKRRSFKAEVATAAEAVRFLLANFPKLEPELAQGHYRVSVGDYDLSEDELRDPSGQQDIKIVPVVAGAGAAARIIAGVALIALSFLIIPLGIAAAGSGIATLVGGLGASLLLGGIAQLLTPIPKAGKDDKDPRKSYSFSGVQNTSRQGVPVPIVYGEILVGSVIISAGIDTVQVA
jgi:predicted phage tail protein